VSQSHRERKRLVADGLPSDLHTIRSSAQYSAVMNRAAVPLPKLALVPSAPLPGSAAPLALSSAPRFAGVAVGDPRRMLAGTDCGFDTSAGMGRVAEDVVWAKLKALADGARLASARLF